MARHFVEGDILCRKIRRRRNHQRMADALRVARRPGQRLHAPQAAAHNRGELADAELIGELRLRIHPVFHHHQGKVGAIRFACGRVKRKRAGRSKARAEIVYADDKKARGIDRFAGAYHVVPPADIGWLSRIDARHMMRGIERMADEDSVGAFCVQRAIGFVHQLITLQHGARAQAQRRVEYSAIGRYDSNGLRCDSHKGAHNKKPDQLAG